MSDVPTCPVCGQSYHQNRGKAAWGCDTSGICKRVLTIMLEVERIEKKLSNVVELLGTSVDEKEGF